MSTLPVTSERYAQAFPELTEAQIERIRPVARVRPVRRGDILFDVNDTSVPFFVLLTGAMEIVQPGIETLPQLIAKHGPREFTGEMSMISGQRCLVRGMVTQDGEFLEADGDGLRSLVAKDSELSEILMRAFIFRRLELINQGWSSVVLLGSQHSAKTLEIREFLQRNGFPYSYRDLDKDKDQQQMLDRFNVKLSEIPVVICNGGIVMRNPTVQHLADCIGLSVKVEADHVHDVLIVGAGPAGLAAAVYGASEGLETLMVETHAPGGQAGSSSKIENYLGFPTGVSGGELAARATSQAQKFGARMMVARSVDRLECAHRPYRVVLNDGEALAARTVVIATGAQYNKPNLPNIQKFEGSGVYYGATNMESQLCGGEEVIVVGGGNSAGQAAAFLAQTASRVHLLVRSGELSSTMSRYLIQRLTENSKVDLHFRTEIVALEGADHLERVTWRDAAKDERCIMPIRHVFVMTGASPRTDWLKGCVAMDDKGFILTGRDLEAAADGQPRWPLERPPQMLETSLPGVFAVGDVRSGNVKRVASAVGEGAISIYLVHRALAEL
ncbi:MAG TPA: FAD-dependent oxidoreductase [Candidatus Limnocylindrales bacterium]|nr:FAD-dependent oxidoreductase [Candidatus Limnocylindrales bacterium]